MFYSSAAELFDSPSIEQRWMRRILAPRAGVRRFSRGTVRQSKYRTAPGEPDFHDSAVFYGSTAELFDSSSIEQLWMRRILAPRAGVRRFSRGTVRQSKYRTAPGEPDFHDSAVFYGSTAELFDSSSIEQLWMRRFLAHRAGVRRLRRGTVRRSNRRTTPGDADPRDGGSGVRLFSHRTPPARPLRV